MTTITLEQLSPTVGAEVVGCRPRRLLDDAACPRPRSRRSTPTACSSSATSTSTTPPRWPSQAARSRRGIRRGREPRDLPGHARPHEEPSRRVPAGHVRLAHRRTHRGHPDHGTSCAARDVATEGGETEFASTYAAYDDLSDDEKERFADVRVVHTLEATQRLVNPNPTDEEVALWRKRPPKVHPLVWAHLSGRRSLVLGATTESVVGRDPAEGRAFLDDLLARATAPDRVYRHSGRSATW